MNMYLCIGISELTVGEEERKETNVSRYVVLSHVVRENL